MRNQNSNGPRRNPLKNNEPKEKSHAIRRHPPLPFTSGEGVKWEVRSRQRGAKGILEGKE